MSINDPERDRRYRVIYQSLHQQLLEANIAHMTAEHRKYWALKGTNIPVPVKDKFRKNLCYFMYPIKDSIWTFHVEQLQRYLSIFNGRKIFTIAQDARSVSADEVKNLVNRKDIEWRVVQNDPVLWETAAFPDMIALVENRNADEFTFYAHAKGVRRPPWAIPNARLWSGLMYFLNLSSKALVERIFESYDALGCFQRQDWNHGGSNWHYSGTYFWFRNSSVFSKDWRPVHPHLYGVEGWLGRHVPIERSYSLMEPNENERWGEQIRENCARLMKTHLETWGIHEAVKDFLFSF